VISDNHIESD